VDIIIIKNNFQTLANIVIADLNYTNLAQCALTTIMHVVIVVAQDRA
jgi:hypothetical protein